MQNLYAQAVRLHQGGHVKQAESLYRQILAKLPKQAETLNALGMLCLQANRFDEACLWLEKAAKETNQAPQVLLNLAEAYRNTGDKNKVVKICQSLIRGKSHLPQAYFYLGSVHHDAQQLKEAVASYQKALQFLPNFPECLNSLGAALDELGNSVEAIRCFKEALRLAPRYVAAHINLAKSLRANGELYEAQAQYHRAMEVGGRNAKFYLEIGDIWVELQDYEKAASSYQEVLKIDPDNARAFNGMGNCEQLAGHRELAEQYLEQSIKLNSLVVTPYFHLANNKKAVSAEDPLIGRIKDKLNEASVKGEQEAVLQFALAKLLDDCREYEQSFGYLQSANKTVFGIADYSISIEAAKFENIKRVYDELLFQRYEKVGSASEQPVFIVGMPRSGTTLTEQIISSHPQVSGAGELRLINIIENRLASRLNAAYPDCVTELDGGILSEEAKWYLDGLKLFTGQGEFRKITDKMPHNFLRLGLIHLLFPNAKIIHCRRDPMDNCLSLYFQMFGSKRHRYCYDLEVLGNYYKLYQSLMQHWREVLPTSMMEVDYEAIVADPEGKSRQLIDFVGLKWDDACLTPHQQSRTVKTASQWQVRQPIYKSSVQRWKNYEAFLDPLKQALGQGA